MASAWIRRVTLPSGASRYRVAYRLGGRESSRRYGGSFERRADAEKRRQWVLGEMAQLRVPDIRALAATPQAPTIAEAAARWQESRVDVSENTRLQHRSAVRAMLPLIGSRRVDTVTPADVADVIAALHAKGRKRETIRKTLLALSMVLDFAGITPNPAKDKVHVRLPRAEREEITPPTSEHVLAVHDLLPSRYKLPLLVLDASGMRLGEFERLAWGDVDEPRARWRVSASASKTGKARWVRVPPPVLRAVLELVPRDDRVPERRVFQGFGGDRFRTAIARACTAAGVPAFSPHDLRHRRISLMHLRGVPWARIGELVGQRNLAVTA